MSKALKLIILAGFFLVLASACGRAASPTSRTGPTLAPSGSIPTTPSLMPGQQLFIAKGCATCHGQSAEGTHMGPALAGHTAEQVEHQVRSPTMTMPAFPPDKVSEEELHEIVEYILSLGGEAHPSHP